MCHCAVMRQEERILERREELIIRTNTGTDEEVQRGEQERHRASRLSFLWILYHKTFIL